SALLSEVVIRRGGEVISRPGGQAGNGCARHIADIDHVGVVFARATIVNVVADHIGVRACAPGQGDALVLRIGGAESRDGIEEHGEKQDSCKNSCQSPESRRPAQRIVGAVGCWLEDGLHEYHYVASGSPATGGSLPPLGETLVLLLKRVPGPPELNRRATQKSLVPTDCRRAGS